MAISFVNSNNSNTASANSLVLTKPTNTADGDIMFASIVNTNYYSNSLPTGWTLLAEATVSTIKYQLFYKVALSEGASYTFGYQANSRMGGVIVSYRGGFNTSNPIDSYSNTSYVVSNTTCRAASINVTASASALLFFGNCFNTNSTTFVKPTTQENTWIENFDNGGSYLWHEVCSMTLTNNGATNVIDATMSESLTDKHAFAVSLNPAPLGPANLKTYNTNVRANIKSINTNLIANVKSLDTNI